MSVEKALFAILQQELGEGKEPNPALKAMDKEISFAVLDLAEKHDIAHLVASAYSKAGLLGKDEVSEKYRKTILKALYRSEQRNYALSEICASLETNQIPHIPLKGSVLCFYYPESWMRSSCDIDILIKEEDTEKAIRGLCDLGYRLQKSTSIRDYSLYSPRGVHLELHFSLIQKYLEKANQLLRKVWDHTVEDPEHPYRKGLSNEMFVLYHIAHMAKHFIVGGCGIRPFMDLWIMKRKMAVDRKRLEQLLKEAKLLDFYRAVMNVVAVWFENEAHNAVTLGIEDHVLRGGVYGTVSSAAVMKAATGEGKLQSFGKLMFMSRESLAILYPNLERHPKLFPFYQVKRWFRIFNKNKRNKILQLTNIRNSVSTEEVRSTAELLERLELNQER